MCVGMFVFQDLEAKKSDMLDHDTNYHPYLCG